MKALVVYGSRYGTSAEISEEIAKVLTDEGMETDLVDSNDIKEFDISPYDLIVVGSGIKIGQWTKSSKNFLKKHKEELKNKNVALFVSCGAANEEESQEEGWKVYLIDFAEKNLINKPIDLALFGSVYDPEAKHGLMFKIVNMTIKKKLEKKGIDASGKIDYRNWDEIRSWSKNLVSKVS